MDNDQVYIHTVSTTSTAELVPLSPFLEQMFLSNLLGFGLIIILLIVIALKK